MLVWLGIDGCLGREVVKTLRVATLHGFRPQISQLGQVRNVTGIVELAMASRAVQVAVKHHEATAIVRATKLRKPDIEADGIVVPLRAPVPLDSQTLRREPDLGVKSPLSGSSFQRAARFEANSSAVDVEYLLLPEVRRSCDVHEGSHELCPSEIGVLDWVQPLGVVKDAIRVSFRRAVNELSVEHVVELARFQIRFTGF